MVRPLPLEPCPTPQARELHCTAPRMCAGWEKGRVKECALEIQLAGPVIIYHITYDDGEEVTSPAHIVLKACSLVQQLTPVRTRSGGGGPAYAPVTKGP